MSRSARHDTQSLLPLRCVRQRLAARDVVIVGDSIYDVRCGVPHDATTIAIASGKTPAELLRAENPHHCFESAEDTAALLAAIVG